MALLLLAVPHLTVSARRVRIRWSIKSSVGVAIVHLQVGVAVLLPDLEGVLLRTRGVVVAALAEDYEVALPLVRLVELLDVLVVLVADVPASRWRVAEVLGLAPQFKIMSLCVCLEDVNLTPI